MPKVCPYEHRTWRYKPQKRVYKCQMCEKEYEPNEMVEL